MKKYFTILILSIIVLLSGCTFQISDRLPNSPEDNLTFTYNENITHYSDNTGIHITVPINMKKTYTNISVYEISGTKDILVAEAVPSNKYYRYLINDTPCGDIGYEHTKKENSEDDIKNISTSARTNFLEGQVDFHLYFLKPGKKYSFLVRLEEEKGENHDVLTNTEGFVNDIYSKYNLTQADDSKKIYHYGTIFSEQVPSDFSTEEFIKANYNSESDQFTFNPIDLRDAKYPFGIVDEKDYIIFGDVKYQPDHKHSTDGIVVNYYEAPLYVSLSQLLEQKSYEPDYSVDYQLSESNIKLSYNDHLTTQIDVYNVNAIDNETKLKYFTELYNQKKYTYYIRDLPEQNIPSSVHIPDNRTNLTVTPVEEGNLIEFSLKNTYGTINIYRTEDNFMVGTISGNITPNTKYSFIDHYPLDGKNTYKLKFGTANSKSSNPVRYTFDRKYIPSKAVSTYDSEKGILTITSNPIAGKIPEGYSENMVLNYAITTEAQDLSISPISSDFSVKKTGNKITAKISIPIKKDTKTVDISKTVKTMGYYKTFIDKSFKCSESENILSITKKKDNVIYTNNYKFTDVSEMADIKILDNRNSGDGNNPFDDDSNAPIPQNIQDDSAGKKEITDYLKIESIEETEKGIALKLYVPECTNTITITRTKMSFKNALISSNLQNLISTYTFNMKKMKYGNITVNDYITEKDSAYEYYIQADSINPATENKTFHGISYNKNQKAYIITSKDPAYYITSIPDIQAKIEEKDFVWNDHFSVDGILKWNSTLPEDYKTLETYTTDKYIYTTNNYRNRLYYYQPVEGYSSSLSFKCIDIINSDKYVTDIYGQKAEINPNDSRCYRTFNCNSGSTIWYTLKVYGTNQIPVRGTYELNTVKTSIFNENGIWQYCNVPFTTQKFRVE